MELLDRYLNAVGKGLPEAQREDIIRELSEDIRSEMEDKEAELHRALTEAEQQAILKRRGNPVVLAARYRQDHRSVAFGPQLIGPVLFPFYIKVLSFNLGLTFIIIATIFIALLIGGQNVTFHAVLSSILLQLVIQLSAVTLIFSMVQRHLNKYPDSWNLRGFGGVHLDLKTDSSIQSAGRGSDQVSRFESVSLIIGSAVALVWLAEVQRHPFLIFGPAAYFLKLAPVWARMYGPIVLLTSLGMVQATVNLFRPRWTSFRTLAQAVLQAAGLVVLYFLLKAGSWVTLADGVAGSHIAGYTRAIDLVNQGIFYGLLVGGLISVVQVVLKIARLIRGQRNTPQFPGVDVKC
jgi:hypothetical protein